MFAHEKLALLGLSCNAFPETYRPRPHWIVWLADMENDYESRLTMHPAIPIMRRLMTVRNIFCIEDVYRPLFMNNQNTELIPSVPMSAIA